MKKVQKTIKELNTLVKQYSRTEYCECGCKGSGYPVWGQPHGLIGKNSFEERVLDPNFVKELGAVLKYLKSVEKQALSFNIPDFE